MKQRDIKPRNAVVYNIMLLLFSLYAFPGISQKLFAQQMPAIDILKKFEAEHGASVAIVVSTADGKVLLRYNEEKRLCPASVTKLFTTAAALNVLGEDFRFTTRVYADGAIRRHTLEGSLIIRGGGDPTIDSHYIPEDSGRLQRDLVMALQQKGVERIAGRVSVDASRYGFEGVNANWLMEDVGNYYGTGVYGFNLNDNSITLYLNSYGAKPVIDSIDPAHPALNWHLILKTGKRDSVYCIVPPFSTQALITGSIPPKIRRYKLRAAIPDPALFAASMIRNKLAAYGIVAEQEAEGLYVRPDYRQADVLMNYVSLPLDTIVRITNYRSVNSYAEALKNEVELTLSQGRGSQLLSANRPYGMIDYWTKRLKYSARELDLYDGSGLSPKGRVTARAINGMLTGMKVGKNTRPSENAFLQSLPVAGEEGSVKSLLKNSRLHARLKSGSMSGVQAYAGYVQWRGQWYAVSFIANNQRENSYARKAFEQFLTKFFQ